jgi:hypothetical protein
VCASILRIPALRENLFVYISTENTISIQIMNPQYGCCFARFD